MRYVTSVTELGYPDMVLLPGSKNTMEDLRWIRQNGLEAAVKKLTADVPVFGICGGFQMLGMEISDPDHTECGGTIRGMELLPVSTVLKTEKTRCQVEGSVHTLSGIFAGLSDTVYQGYEIHMGETVGADSTTKLPVIVQAESQNIYGTYVHGIFDRAEIASEIISSLSAKKGISMEHNPIMDYAAFKETQYDKLADILREYLDMEAIYGMLREARME